MLNICVFHIVIKIAMHFVFDSFFVYVCVFILQLFILNISFPQFQFESDLAPKDHITIYLSHFIYLLDKGHKF